MLEINFALFNTTTVLVILVIVCYIVHKLDRGASLKKHIFLMMQLDICRGRIAEGILILHNHISWGYRKHL